MTEIRASSWHQIVRRAWQESKNDNLSMLAAGVAFFGFLAVFPALIAALLIYGLIVPADQVTHQVDRYAKALPPSARQVISHQLTSVSDGGRSALGIGLVIALAGALWSASGGASNLIKALNVAYDELETRGFLKLRGTALLLTLGGIVFMVITVGLVAVVPALLTHLHLGGVGRLAAQVLRWLLLVAAVIVGLAVVYRAAPDRKGPQPRLRWASLGAVVATVLWIIGSVAFSFYVTTSGTYSKAYGALGGVIVLMLWLFLTSYLVLIGAEINSQVERTAAPTNA